MKRICYFLKRRISIAFFFCVTIKDKVLGKNNCPDKDENFHCKKVLWENIEGLDFFSLPLSLTCGFMYTIEEHNFSNCTCAQVKM